MAGWALVLKETTDVNGRVMRGWKRRFLEVDKGELRVFNTETPNNFALGRVAQVGINLQLTPGEAVMDVLNGGRSLLRFCGSDGTIRTLAEQLMEFKLGGEKHSSANMMNTGTRVRPPHCCFGGVFRLFAAQCRCCPTAARRC